MVEHYKNVKTQLLDKPKTWLITGVAGFIGSNLLEALLKLNQTIVGLDNFATGHQLNLDNVQKSVEADQWNRFTMIEGDIRNIADCKQAIKGADYVLHQAALGSVPRSIKDPITSNGANVDGFLNMLVAARDAQVRRFVYAASSSTYGDHTALPKVEDRIGNPLSPYAVTKYVNELYANVFARNYELDSIGLRYFNVFGKRQDPKGAYAAVIPKWINSLIRGENVYINGDGKTSRDFCYIDNAVQANLLAATNEHPDSSHQIFNIAVGESTSLNNLYKQILNELSPCYSHVKELRPIYCDFRPGDVRHSLADITKAKSHLGYMPTHSISEGLIKTVSWYRKKNSYNH